MANCLGTFRVQPFFIKQQSKLQIKEKWSFSFVIKRKIATKRTMHHNSAVSKALLGKF